MDGMETIINIDELFTLWNSRFEEIKRKVLGKYTKENESFNIEDQIYVYRGPDICNHKFNFLFPGNRCKMCSSLLLLNDEGEFTDKPIRIEHGKYRGNSIIVEIHDKPRTHFGENERIHPNMTNVLLTLSPATFLNTEFFVRCLPYKNKYDDLSNYAIMSSLFHEFGIKTRFLCAYVCNTTKIIKLRPNFIGTLEGIHMNSNFAGSILKSIVSMVTDCNIVHNMNQMEFLSFEIKNSKLTTYIDPSPKTTFSNKGYYDRNILLVTRHQNMNTTMKSVPTGVLFTSDDKFMCYDDSFKPISPVIQLPGLYYTEYVNSTEELFEFTENTGINAFKPFQFYIWLMVLLCEKKFYECIDSEFLSYIFFPDDIENVKRLVVEQHDLETKYDDVRRIMIEINIKMRIDILLLIGELIETLF